MCCLMKLSPGCSCTQRGLASMGNKSAAVNNRPGFQCGINPSQDFLETLLRTFWHMACNLSSALRGCGGACCRCVHWGGGKLPSPSLLTAQEPHFDSLFRTWQLIFVRFLMTIHYIKIKNWSPNHLHKVLCSQRFGFGPHFSGVFPKEHLKIKLGY